MSGPLTSKLGFVKRLGISRRDFQVFAFSTCLFTSIAAGAVTLETRHAQASSNGVSIAVMDGKGICSASKYFR